MAESTERASRSCSNALAAPATPSGRLPYAVAIAAGTAPYLVYAAACGASPFA